MVTVEGVPNLGDEEFKVLTTLKADHFGCVERGHHSQGGHSFEAIRRRTQHVSWWTRGLAAWLLRREVRALEELQGVAGVPSVLRVQRTELIRSWLPGLPLQLAEPPNAEWFEQARRLLARCHRKGVAHNDSAKEPNWLVLADGTPGLVDFQLASCKPRRGFWFRMMAREDLRHLLKHKRTYCPHHLTEREQYILSAPSWPARLWRATGKRVYTFVTRRILGWSDREGAGDRRAPSGRPW